MLAAHFENLLFLLLLVLAGLFQLLARAARKTSEDKEESTPRPAPRMQKPIPRAPAESDQERIRKFLEALGQPPAPRAWKVIRRERRKHDVIRRETPPPEIVKRTEEVFPPAMTVAPAFEVHEGPLLVEQPSIIKRP